MRYRLNRLEQIYEGYSIYFITCCTYRRLELLANKEIHDAFCRFGEEAGKRNIFIGRYVIMPDHLHFFVTLPEDQSLSLWMKSLKNSLSKGLRQVSVLAPHWQKGFFDHVLRSDRSYEDKWLYVHENPVRKGLVATADLWPYQGEINRVTFD